MTFTLILILTVMLIDPSQQHGIMSNFVREEQLQGIIHDIVQTTNIHDVIVLTQGRQEDENTTRVISTVSETVSRLVPTQYIDTIKVPETMNPSTTSRSLIIYIYSYYRNFRRESWGKIVSDAYALWHSSSNPKILLLLVENEANTRIQDLFRYLWSKKILQVEILEILPSKEPNQELVIVAHQYNPFTDDYTRTYNPRNAVIWYPNKLTNMHANPLNVYKIPEFEYTRSTNTIIMEITRLQTLGTIADIMNFTITVTANRSESDIFLHEYNHLHDLVETVHHVGSIYDFDMCLLTPILPAKTIALWNFLGMVCFGAGILILSFTAFTLLAANRRLRHPMYLINLLLGFSVTWFPTFLTERILFLSLVAASTRYTSMFYAELFDLALINQEFEINSFDDLIKSDLSILIDRSVYSEVLKTTTIPAAIKEKMIPMDSMLVIHSMIYATTFFNTSYFFERAFCNLIASAKHDASGQAIFKTTDLCLTMQHFFYIVPKRSPYTEQLDEQLLRVIASGYQDYVGKTISAVFLRGTAKLHRLYPIKQSVNIPFPFVASLCGYCLSLVVFIGEIVVHRHRRNKKLAGKIERKE